MKLYYKKEVIRLFLSSFGATRLIILQGISGTGKTSLAYAWGKFLKHDSCVVSVQPSWRDRTELFGYFNEFTKKFNETQLLECLYTATFTDDVVQVRNEFKNLKNIFETLKENYFKANDSFKEISMGMSDDYPIAIEEGATMVRVGSKIFGARNYNV